MADAMDTDASTPEPGPTQVSFAPPRLMLRLLPAGPAPAACRCPWPAPPPPLPPQPNTPPRSPVHRRAASAALTLDALLPSPRLARHASLQKPGSGFEDLRRIVSLISRAVDTKQARLPPDDQ